MRHTVGCRKRLTESRRAQPQAETCFWDSFLRVQAPGLCLVLPGRLGSGRSYDSVFGGWRRLLVLAEPRLAEVD